MRVRVCVAVAALGLLAWCAPAAADLGAIGTSGYTTIYGGVVCPWSVASSDGVEADGTWWWTAEAGPSFPYPDGCEIWSTAVDGLDPGEFHVSARHGVLVGGSWRWETVAVPHSAGQLGDSGDTNAWSGAATRVEVRACMVGTGCTAWVTVLDSATMS